MVVCEQCGKSFKPKSKKPNRFCSQSCYWLSMKGKPPKNADGLKLGRGWNKGKRSEWLNGEKNRNWKGGKVDLVCQECEKLYHVWNYLKDTSRYCSRECSTKNTLSLGRGWNKGVVGEESHMIGNKHCVGRTPWNVGVNHTDEAKLKMSEGHRSNPTRYWSGKKRPDISEMRAGKPNYSVRGEKNHNWKGGTTKELKRLRSSLEFKNWRRFVFERDDYTCQECGVHGVHLHPHHIESFADNPDIRFDVSNGTTLCKRCHNMFHGLLKVSGD
jgi:hypothetical protein